MIKYAYNSCKASGRLQDGIDLVKSQKRLVAFDYNFATQEGAVLFNIHAQTLRMKCNYSSLTLSKMACPSGNR